MLRQILSKYELALCPPLWGGGQMRGYTNNCIIKLPYGGEVHNFYKNEINLKGLVEIFIEHWKPEYIKIDKERIFIETAS